MRQIVPPFRLIQKILGEQKAREGVSYRLSAHCVRVRQPKETLLYHTLTGELLLLSNWEAERFVALPGPVPPALAGLVPRWFLRPEGADDMALADQTREIAERMKRMQKKPSALRGYTIFTTTGCNARCFYCYEAGWKATSMTEQTARDTADYIAAHCGGKHVHLSWFGGEPLLNAKAIDTITDGLQQRGVSFRSGMTSNGYLFDEALARRARDVWNLQHVQITLDGTEDVYNRRKAYVHAEGSPYRRVLRNIDLLLDAGVRVKVRLNMDAGNERDLYALVDALAARFAGRPGFGVYVAAIREGVGQNPPHYTDGQRRAYAQKIRSLDAYAEAKGVLARFSLNRQFPTNACMADSDSAAVVMPDGRLGLCEDREENALWGSIYTEEADETLRQSWKARMPAEDACRACALYPQCIRLKKCSGCQDCCSLIDRASKEDRLLRAILGTYEDWKKENPEAV